MSTCADQEWSAGSYAIKYPRLRWTELPPSWSRPTKRRWAGAPEGSRGAGPSRGRAAGGQGVGGAGPPLAPAFPARPQAGGGPGSGRSPAARWPAAALAASHPGRASSGKGRPRVGAPAARAAVRAAYRARRARSEEPRRRGRPRERRAGVADRPGLAGASGGGRRAPGSASRALAWVSHAPGSRAAADTVAGTPDAARDRRVPAGSRTRGLRRC